MLRVIAAATLGALVFVGAAHAGPEEQLAEMYAPVVRLVEQAEECGPGEPYRPIDVDALFGEETVSLRGPWRRNDLVKIAPSADDLGSGLYEYNLDFPGDALEPGCDYERWARRIEAGTEPTVYAHVATEAAHPGKVSLQYWLYYPFNDWNNTHEGDWEMIQLVFAAADAEDALDRLPIEVGYSQHEGAERASWGDDKLEVVSGTHPVVYPAAGSHANFFDAALFLGRSASEGVGCDDTTGPHVDLRPDVRTIPSDADAAAALYPWIAFEGRWGERREAFFNGPTGPNLKTQWAQPITWSEGWRTTSQAIPGGGALGTSATDFFCGAVAAGSNFVRRFATNPTLTLGILAVLLALAVWLAMRTTWRPTAPLRVPRRRSWGQVVSATWRMYLGRPRLFIGIGLVTIPISIVVALIQSGVLGVAGLIGLAPSGEGGGIRAELVLAVGGILTLFGLAFVQAAAARAMVEVDAGRDVGVVRAFRLTLDSVRSLLGAAAIAVPIVTLLTLTVILIPVAAFLAVRWALFVPCVELEGCGAVRSLRRSGSLVRREWWKVLSLVVVTSFLVIIVGPVAGGLLLLGTSVPYAFVNVVAGLLYAVLMPLIGITTTYVYFDTRTREELATREPSVAELPAEIALRP